MPTIYTLPTNHADNVGEAIAAATTNALASAVNEISGRSFPSRSILERIDPVASDHTAVVRQAFVDYPHWFIPPSTTVKLKHNAWATTGTGGSIQIPDGGSLVGQDANTSVVSVTEASTDDTTKAVFLLIGPNPRQTISDVAFQGIDATPMTWFNWQSAIFYENMGNAGGAQSVLRKQEAVFRRCSFKAYKGFPVHSEYARVNVEHCSFVDCGNGVNINGAGSVVNRSYFERAEGCEMSGPGAAVTDNLFVNGLNVAVSVGGYFSAAHPEFHSALVSGNRVYGVTGGGIIVAESMSDVDIVANYLEACTTFGIQAVDQGTYLSNGVNIADNHVVSCGTNLAMWVAQNNARVVGNRVYNRADLTPAPANCISFNGQNQIADLNQFTPSGTTAYAVDFNTSVRNMAWGPNNQLAAGTSGTIQVQAGATFRDARHLGYAARTVGAATNILEHERVLLLDAQGAARTITIPSAVGKPGKTLQFKKIDTAAFNHVIDPSGSETIDGALTKTMSSQYAALAIVSDGANWNSVSTMGTVT